ncbi:TetR/AcrR family transcriptional regulator [Maricurvus nonylphenolicus]|uniref:TetR/AcrR family transcriptional regulator n=1 Tax=Maricurvus nonylphenolicus TaxID=1008307 RepID=UPI0036F3B160
MGKPEETYRMILDAAASTLVRLPGASLQDIAKAAGVGRATIHRYFRKRDDLIKELAQISLQDTSSVIEGVLAEEVSAAEKLRKLAATLLPMANRYQFLSFVWEMLDDPEIYRMYNRQMSCLHDLIDACKAEGHISPAVSTRWIASAFDSLIYAAWLSLEYGEIARNDASDLVVNTLINGVAPAQG